MMLNNTKKVKYSTMKKVILFLLIGLSLNLNAQLKTVKGTSGSNQSSHESPQLLSKIPYNSDAVTRFGTQTFTPRVLQGQNINLEGTIHSVINNQDNRPIAISATLDYNSRSNQNSLTKAHYFLNSVKDILKITDVEEQFTITSESIDELAMHHVTLQQMYKEIPVFGAESKLHGVDGNFDFFNGSVLQVEELDVNPDFDVKSSSDVAIQDAGGVYLEDKNPLGIFNEEILTELVVYPYNGKFYLAHHHTFYSDLMHRWEYFVDAHTGKIINKYTSVCTFHNHNSSDHKCSTNHGHEVSAKKKTVSGGSLIMGAEKATAVDLLGITREIDTYLEGSTYYMIDASRTDMFNPNSNMPNEPVGAIWTIDGFNTSPQTNNFDYGHVSSSNNTWNDRSSVSAQFNGARAYLYFRNLHGRNSINGSGGNIVSFVNIADEGGQSMGNAFWNGAAMFYGNGDSSFGPLAAGLDVAGHEMTHGVVQNTANLEYQGESGALNESFADVFGVMIDRDDWLVGEDVVKTAAFPSGALRSMSNPHNGAATGDFNSGWQPKTYSERFTGSQDNGGVHINSGIPNHAFYLFANDSRLGASDNDRKVKAERVYYRALSNYLTRSSQFVDCRVAVVKAAGDLYGDAVIQAARDAFDAVEIFGENGGTYTNDSQTNPGDDLIVFTTANQNNLYIFTPDGQEVANPLTENNPISKPSVSDAGDIIVFVGEDKMIHYITIDWMGGSAEEIVLNITGTNQWRNAVISKDGRLLAALRDQVDKDIVVFDLSAGNSITYELFNPTYSTGVSTGDVLYADAMEFDYTGEYLMYDANNSITSQSAGSIEFWDIGFLKVWNKDAETFTISGQIEKLFQGLPEGVSIGNPTFSKNSNYIIAFDFIEEGDFSILGANVETGTVGLIFDNSEIGYPSYSRTDEQLVFDNVNNGTVDLGIAGIAATKIDSDGSAAFLYLEDVRWGTWFSNGLRNFTSVNDQNIDAIQAKVTPNPTSDLFLLEFTAKSGQESILRVVSADGKEMSRQEYNVTPGNNSINVNIEAYPPGQYFLVTLLDEQIVTLPVVKI